MPPAEENILVYDVEQILDTLPGLLDIPAAEFLPQDLSIFLKELDDGLHCSVTCTYPEQGSKVGCAVVIDRSSNYLKASASVGQCIRAIFRHIACKKLRERESR